VVLGPISEPVLLPGGASKIAMLAQSLEAFSNAGYVYVGMDHFALPNDALAVAKRQGRLHRMSPHRRAGVARRAQPR